MRLVFDTNVLISAFLIGDSAPARALTLAEDRGIVLYSIPVLEEITQVLSRSKFARYLDLDEVPALLARIHRSWQEVHIIHTIRACRDPQDDKFLELAVSGQATHIITGDKDLLALNPFNTIIVLTPAEFLSLT